MQGAIGQNHKQVVSDIDKIIQEIKKNNTSFQKIEKLKDSTGYRYLYLKGDDLQLVRVFFKDEHIDKKIEWYFSKGQLIYSQQIWKDNTTGKTIDNQKCYLNNEQLITWIKSGSAVDPSTKEFKEVSAGLSAYASKMKTAIK